MPTDFILQISTPDGPVKVAATLVVAGADATRSQRDATTPSRPGVLLVGDRDYHATLVEGGYDAAALTAAKGRFVRVTFPGRSPVRHDAGDGRDFVLGARQAQVAVLAVLHVGV